MVAQTVPARRDQQAGRARPVGGSTAARAVAVDRRRRRRAGRWGAGVLAVVLLGTGASLARSAVTDPSTAAPSPSLSPAPRTSSYAAPAPTLYDSPVRGSLADDEEFLAAMAATPWTGPAGPDGEIGYWGGPTPDLDTSRVVYAADVPGGHRWAVVVARSGTGWAWGWFTGARGAEPAEMTLVFGSMPLGSRERLALIDASAETGTLVVLGEPGLEAEYSPSLDRAPSGELVRDFDPLPMIDGVPVGVVPVPVIWSAGEVRVIVGGVASEPLFPMLDGQPPSWPEYPTGPVDNALVAPCLESLGLRVELQENGAYLNYEDPSYSDSSSAELAAREHEIAACFRAGEG
ncbi:hypothetical protein [Modestobacter marinus]|uniref:hypothetical protein n=1 Tax=Modestobacter marinus TaxID=477641 RepID=UPI00201A9EEE|nr:hypothetical protein [Modestobacter marinus]